MMYFIQAEGCVGNDALWWRPNRAGYTTHVGEAGLYTEEEARSIERIRGTDKAWPMDQMQALCHHAVDVNKLRALTRENA